MFFFNNFRSATIWIETANDCSLILSTFLTFSILIWHFSLIFRSAIWIEADNDCSLMDVDRHVLAGTTSFQPQPGKAFKIVSSREALKDASY